MAYIVDWNLYFQEGSKPPLQLTYSQGYEYRLVLFFSEDGKKIFYFQGNHQDLYSISVDGTQEQALLTNSLLLTLDADYDEATTLCDPLLVPHTNILLVRTCTHSAVGMGHAHNDLLLIDADTGEVRLLLPRGKGGWSYSPSPDGSMLAFAQSGRIHIVGLDSKMIRRDLATYTPGNRYEPYSIEAQIYWLPDSRGFILALPVSTDDDPGFPQTYEIWRYWLDTGIMTQINLDPPVMGPTPARNFPVRVSPDGNWITYTNQAEDFCYLGDLRDGRTYSYGPSDLLEWSPDSVHFLYNSYKPSNRPGLHLASIHEPSVLVGNGAFFIQFVGWLDATRYVYLDKGGYTMREIGGDPMLILTGDLRPLTVYGNIIFHYHSSSE